MAENATGGDGTESAAGALPRGRERLALVLIVLLALVLRVGVVAEYERGHPAAEHPVIDEASYEDWALEIAGGNWLGDEVFFQEPLYPYWLGAVYAVCGHDRTVARMIQAGLGALCVLLVHRLTREVFGARPALWAAFGLAVYRADLLLPALLLKPNLFLPLWALLAWGLVRSRRARGARSAASWLGLGVLAGLGALLRGNVLILVPALAVWPLVRARTLGTGLPAGLRDAASLAAGVLLVLLPVALRNQHVGGVFALTTSGAGTNVYGGNNPDNPYGRATEFKWVRGIPRYEAEDWKHEAERRTGRALDASEVSGFWLREAGRSVLADPGLHLRILWNKLRLTLGRYEVPDNHHLDWDARYVALLRWPWPGWGALGTLALAGALLVLAGRRGALPGSEPFAPREPGAALELLVLGALYLATIVLTVTSMRVRLALLPTSLPFAGWCAHALWTRLAPGSSRAAGPRPLVLAGALLLGAVFPLWPVYDAGELAEDLDKRDFNYAVHLVARGEDLAEAERIALGLEQRYGTLRVRTLLAEIAFLRAQREERGSPEQTALLGEALERLQSVALHPGVFPRERFRALRLAGDVQMFLGRWDVAVRRYREAREFDPADETLRLALANALFLDAADLAEPERDAALAEAEALLAELVAAGRDDLAAHLEEVRAARSAAGE